MTETELKGSRYVLGASLGPGTLGPAFSATHAVIGHEVVVELVAWSGVSAAAIEAYTLEARAAAQIESDHVAKVLEIERLGAGRIVAVREVAPGRRLDRVLAEDGPLGSVAAIGVLRQILPVLSAAHDLGVLHRGLDTTSVWLEARGEGDFIARLTDFCAVTLLPVAKRPPHAPEFGPGVPYDQRVDVYAIGRVAYAMLAGRDHREGDACSKLGNIPTSVARVVDRCLWDKAQERMEHMREAEAALMEAQLAAGIVTPHDTRPPPTVSPERLALLRAAFGTLPPISDEDLEDPDTGPVYADAPGPSIPPTKEARVLRSTFEHRETLVHVPAPVDAAVPTRPPSKHRGVAIAAIGALALAAAVFVWRQPSAATATAAASAASGSATEPAASQRSLDGPAVGMPAEPKSITANDDDPDAVGMLNRAARAAAAQGRHAFPTPGDAQADTAYSRIVELETLADPDAIQSAKRLRTELAARIRVTADLYWDLAPASAIPAALYSQVLVFAPDDARSLERSSDDAAALDALRRTAAERSFTREELVELEPLAIVLLRDADARAAALRVHLSRTADPDHLGPLTTQLLAIAREPAPGDPGALVGGPPHAVDEFVPEDLLAETGETGETDPDEPVIDDVDPPEGGTDDDVAARKAEAFKLAQLGTAAVKAGDRAKGIRYFEAALKRNPRLAYAHDALSQVYFDSKEFASAAAHGRLAVGASPNTARFRVHYGDALLRRKDPTGALEQYRAAKRIGHPGIDRRIERAGG